MLVIILPDRSIATFVRWFSSFGALSALLLLGLLAGAEPTQAAPAGSPELAIHDATLLGNAGRRSVSLPHRLEPADFDARGGRVRYLLEVNLDRSPAEPLGVYLRKLSLSGNLQVNGRPAGACGSGPLEALRCLHRPQLFIPPVDVWRVGRNTLEFEIFANDRQMNGLGTVVVGDAEALDHGPFRLRMLWQVETIRALTWMAVTLGLLSLAVGAVLRTDPVYLWFGLASLANAASNLNVLVTAPPVGFELFSWFVFASRLISATLTILAMLAFFDRTTAVRRRLLVVCAVLMPALLWVFGNERLVLVGLYVPLQLAAAALAVASVRWSLRSRRPTDAVMALSYCATFGVGILDYFRLGGIGAFEGVYLIAYASATLITVFGATLVSLLASALMTARRLTRTLDIEVAARTSDLAQANSRLAELSTTDGLTGVANRRRFDEALASEWNRARRDGNPLSLLMVDVDHFKSYNDRLGHLAGDDCLRQVARALREHARRPGDLLARYGGEEFALLTRTDREHAARLAERLREDILALDAAHPDSEEGRVTISVGVATLRVDPESAPSDLVRMADEALYAAKAAGRNRVVAAQGPRAAGVLRGVA